jgi:aminoglycoside phosphotransferase
MTEAAASKTEIITQNPEMAAFTTEDDFKTATWLVGDYDLGSGVFITTSNILVKFGSQVKAHQEAEAMRFVRKTCPQIPMPEVLGSWDGTWQGEEGLKFLAMTPMPGEELSKLWPTMSAEDRDSVKKDLAEILTHLRKIPVPPDAKIGPVGGGLASDPRASDFEYGGPFDTEADFNEWLLSMIHQENINLHASFYKDSLKSCMKNNHKLHFTHGDLGVHNILAENGRITAIIDWEFAGWYPEYREYVKMIQFSRDKEFRCFARSCWENEEGEPVTYDEEFVVEQILDGQVRHGERVLRRPR